MFRLKPPLALVLGALWAVPAVADTAAAAQAPMVGTVVPVNSTGGAGASRAPVPEVGTVVPINSSGGTGASRAPVPEVGTVVPLGGSVPASGAAVPAPAHRHRRHHHHHAVTGVAHPSSDSVSRSGG